MRLCIYQKWFQYSHSRYIPYQIHQFTNTSDAYCKPTCNIIQPIFGPTLCPWSRFLQMFTHCSWLNTFFGLELVFLFVFFFRLLNPYQWQVVSDIYPWLLLNFLSFLVTQQALSASICLSLRLGNHEFDYGAERTKVGDIGDVWPHHGHHCLLDISYPLVMSK